MVPSNRVIRVLVADDSTAALSSVCRYLEFEQHFDVVATATDGIELLREAAVHRPDLVLTDLSMPFLTGLAATKVLRKAYPDMRIIIFTELDLVPLRDECLRSGADGFIEKSHMPEKLMEEVRRLFPSISTP